MGPTVPAKTLYIFPIFYQQDVVLFAMVPRNVGTIVYDGP